MYSCSALQMSEEKKETALNPGLLVGGLGALGISAAGLMLASNNAQVANDTNTSAQTESVINLPATNEKVNGLENRLDAGIGDVNEQINRRERETYEFVKTLDEKKAKRVDGLEQRIYRLEKIFFAQKNL